MDRKEAFKRIASVAVDGGFTYLDVLSVTQEVTAERRTAYIKAAYELGYITTTPNGLTYYPTPKLRKIRAEIEGATK